MTESAAASAVRPSKGLYWTGWVLSVLPSLLLLFSATMKFFPPPDMDQNMAKMGLPMSILTGLGVLELSCTLVYLFPPTAVIGAILLTGYLGGAMLTHLRIGEGNVLVMHVTLGVVLWLGIFLRDRRLWALIPWRK
ncbi:MAG: DoxX family protein [Planctomycetota bacterium]|nr:DoxX family protein [Planctomycetota bacterium]